MKSKHIPFFALLEACKKEGCPLCFLTTDAVRKFFRHLLYEHVNDVSFRDVFRRNQGFCAAHSHQFLESGDGQAAAIIHQDLLRHKLRELKSSRLSRALNRRSQSCSVCKHRSDIESQYISLIVDFIRDGEFRKALEGSEGLCVPHYETVLKNVKSTPKWFSEFHRGRYERMIGELERYIDSCNYSLGGRRPVLSAEEQQVWRRAVDMLKGMKG